MKNQHSHVHVLYQQALEQFERHLPVASTGYVRSLKKFDEDHPYYAEGWFGFFAANGDLVGSDPDREKLIQRARIDGGYTQHQLH